MIVGLAMALRRWAFYESTVVSSEESHGFRVLCWIFRRCFPCFSASRNRQMTSLVNWDGKWGWWGSLETSALFPEELFMLKVRYIFTPARSSLPFPNCCARLARTVWEQSKANERIKEKRIYISRLLWSPPSVGVHSVSSAISLLKSKSGVRE